MTTTHDRRDAVRFAVQSVVYLAVVCGFVALLGLLGFVEGAGS